MQEDYTRQHKVHIFKKGARSRNRSNVLVIKLAQDWLACTRINTICEVFFRLSRPLLSGLFFDCESIADPEVRILYIYIWFLSGFSSTTYHFISHLLHRARNGDGTPELRPHPFWGACEIKVRSRVQPSEEAPTLPTAAASIPGRPGVLGHCLHVELELRVQGGEGADGEEGVAVEEERRRLVRRIVGRTKQRVSVSIVERSAGS